MLARLLVQAGVLLSFDFAFDFTGTFSCTYSEFTLKRISEMLFLAFALLCHTIPILGWSTPALHFPHGQRLPPSSISLYQPTRNSEIGLARTRAVITDSESAGNPIPINPSYDRGFSFSVAGLLFPYHLGVADLLKEKQLIVQGTPLSGSSGGALAATLIALSFSGLDIDRVLETTQAAYTELRCQLQLISGDRSCTDAF